MSSKWYGNIINRLEEDRMFCNQIEVGTGCTIYHWSDRDAYEVIEVKDQTHLRIRELDHKKEEGADWCENRWILSSNPDNPEKEIVKRGKYWYTVVTASPEYAREAIERRNNGDSDGILFFAMNGWNAEEIANSNRARHKYNRVNISFGKADYYYDYEF